MSQPRYERLSSGSQLETDGRSNHSILRRGNFSRHYDDADDDNEEIELGTEHHIRYESDGNGDDDDAEEDCYVNGYLNKSAANKNVNTRDNVHNESGGVIGSPTTAHLPGTRLFQVAVGTLATILLYLALSICLTFYQQALMKKLKFPLSIVTYHLVIKFMLSAAVRAVYKCRVGKTRVQLDWRTAWRKMAPAGIASGIDIGFSNWGLELVPISLYTMTKSSTIVFILFFAILLGLEKKSLSLVFIVGLIAIGLFMFTYESAQFNALGFIFILVASLSSGIRWSFAQFVMQKLKLGLHNPIDMIYHMQPWMIASLLPFLVAFEGQPLYDVLRDLSSTSNEVIYMIIFKITIGAVLAFLMEVSEFLVLSKTSSLTLSIAGIFKDICQLALGIEINGDQLSLVNVLGLLVCLCGISLHLMHKYSTLSKLETLEDDDQGLHFNETSIGTSGGNGEGASAISSSNSANNNAATQKQHSAQTVPLLEQTDSDDSNNEDNEQSASDVIFDVLKRRDMQR